MTASTTDRSESVIDVTAVLRRHRQHLIRWIWKRLDRRSTRGFWPQWCLLVGRIRRPEHRAPDPATLVPIWPPPDRFWADPFLWFHQAQPYIFFEEYRRGPARGRISAIRLGDDLQPEGTVIPVLDESRHLSYPFLFEYQGVLYMVPESARTRRVDLYRCERFPDRWVRLHSLLTGIEAADATLFEQGGRWWLFCAARIGGTRINESLFAFHADSPLSRRWVPHRRNPLVRDYRRGRPAGRVFVDSAGCVVRPAQDCSRRYGCGLGLYEIETLTPELYHERCRWRSDGRSIGNWRAVHHLDWRQGVVAMDAQRLIADDPVSDAERCRAQLF